MCSTEEEKCVSAYVLYVVVGDVTSEWQREVEGERQHDAAVRTVSRAMPDHSEYFHRHTHRGRVLSQTHTQTRVLSQTHTQKRVLLQTHTHRRKYFHRYTQTHTQTRTQTPLHRMRGDARGVQHRERGTRQRDLLTLREQQWGVQLQRPVAAEDLCNRLKRLRLPSVSAASENDL